MSDESNVKTDYDTGGTSTTVDSPAAPPQLPDIEPAKYGTGKPTRVIIRAKITHGSEDQG